MTEEKKLSKGDRNFAILALILIIVILGMLIEWGIAAAMMGIITFLIGLLGDSFVKYYDKNEAP